MDKTEESIKRAARASSLLIDPVMKEAREHIDSELYRLFKETKPTDTEALSQISGMQYMHSKYLAFLNLCLNDGKLAKLELDRKAKLEAKPGLKDRLFGR